MNKLRVIVGSVSAGAVLAVALASPAGAAVVPVERKPNHAAALSTYLATAQRAVTPIEHAAALAGARLSDTHGGALLWTTNTFEWYWNATKITSSKGWQTNGFVFPNTASNGGMARTYKGAKVHDWRAINIIGVGVVSPWGPINVYRTAYTRYYELKRGGGHSVS
jgi:choline dehydrogenase-like flavoprotein